MSNLMATYLTGTAYQTKAPLGCDGTKYVNDAANVPFRGTDGTLSGFAPQLHLVDAAHLSTGPIAMEQWQSYFESLNGDLLSFNRFMDNKVGGCRATSTTNADASSLTPWPS